MSGSLPPSTLFADRALLCREYSISVPNTCGETISKPLGLILGQVYIPSRLQLTRQSLHSITKWEWHRLDVGLNKRSKRWKGKSGAEVQSEKGAFEWEESEGGY